MRLNNKGFTLLEIIIVIIIIGVLASLALPRLLNTVQSTYAGEAWQNISVIRGAIDRCNMLINDYQNCDTLADLDIADPGTATNAHFTYGMGATATIFTITATRTTRDGGTTTDTVVLMQDDTAQQVTRSGSGLWHAIQ